ncbi:MAG: hypothetical protein RJA99_2756 [Pseudomonadota bacterium]|jgi:DNA-binding GntR family transcriptional regulator
MHTAPAVPPLAKHALISRVLADDISRGVYPVGTTLPSESDLSGRFDVSRHTVRAALRTLQERGLITPRPGVGSVVRAARDDGPWRQTFGSVEDLLQYTRTTRVTELERESFKADDDFVARIGGRPGEAWLRLRLRRTLLGDDTPLTVADVFVPRPIADALGELPGDGAPIFERIRALGEPIVEIRQEIGATLPDAAEARALAIDARRPVLVIVRRYHGERGRLLEVTRTVHPADGFTYRMDVRQSPGRGP